MRWLLYRVTTIQRFHCTHVQTHCGLCWYVNTCTCTCTYMYINACTWAAQCTLVYYCTHNTCTRTLCGLYIVYCRAHSCTKDTCTCTHMSQELLCCLALPSMHLKYMILYTCMYIHSTLPTVLWYTVC